MEKYKNLIPHLLLLLLAFSSCAANRKNEAENESIPAKAIKVTVTDYRELDGCEFLLFTQDGKKLQPVNLPDKFKKNGLSLFITFRVVEGMGICMAGEMVELIFVQEAKDK